MHTVHTVFILVLVLVLASTLVSNTMVKIILRFGVWYKTRARSSMHVNHTRLLFFIQMSRSQLNGKPSSKIIFIIKIINSTSRFRRNRQCCCCHNLAFDEKHSQMTILLFRGTKKSGDGSQKK